MSADALPAVDFALLPPLYVVRHGQTGWNAAGRLQGQTDTDISDRGRAQADRNGELLKRQIADAAGFDFIASPLRRTRETMARIRAAMELEPEGFRTDARLLELHFGTWQGFTYAEVEAREPGSLAAREADKWGFVPPGEGGESYALLAARVAPFLESLSGPSVCVTHGGIIRAVFALSRTMSREEAALSPIPQDKVLRVEGGRPEGGNVEHRAKSQL